MHSSPYCTLAVLVEALPNKFYRRPTTQTREKQKRNKNRRFQKTQPIKVLKKKRRTHLGQGGRKKMQSTENKTQTLPLQNRKG